MILLPLLLLWQSSLSVNDRTCPLRLPGPTYTPLCCSSGYLTKGICGYNECAKAEDEACGGPDNVDGVCARNLQCLIKCQCNAEGDTGRNYGVLGKCIFPFKYNGTEYDSCTTANSDNGKAWCAYEVDKDGVVVNGKWGDCYGSGCGLEGKPCQGYVGKCIRKNSDVDAITDRFLRRNMYHLEDGTGINDGRSETIQRCQTPAQQFQCRCAERSKCIEVNESWKPTTEYEHYNGPDYGWCWLENLYSHTNLASYCYDDVHYDHRHGRFYSSKACNPDEDPKDKE